MDDRFTAIVVGVVVAVLFLLLWGIYLLLGQILQTLETIYRLLNDQTHWAGKNADALRRNSENLKDQK